MIIATGGAETHPTPLPLDATGLPGVAPPTAVADSAMVQGGVADATGQRLSQLAAGEADIAAAMSSGMGADSGRRQRYQAGILPPGGNTGDLMDLPEVPAFMVPPTDSYDYLGTGDEPVQAG